MGLRSVGLCVYDITVNIVTRVWNADVGIPRVMTNLGNVCIRVYCRFGLEPVPTST